MDKLKMLTITKWLVLSVVSSWYVPQGLLVPITINYKIQLSEIIKVNELSWDEDNSEEELSNHWREFSFQRSTKPVCAFCGMGLSLHTEPTFTLGG